MGEYSAWAERRQQGKPKYSKERKINSSAILSTMNCTWPGLGLNPADLCSDRPLTDHFLAMAQPDIHVSLTLMTGHDFKNKITLSL
jgi:hypothetical protein